MPEQKLYPNAAGWKTEWAYPLFDPHWSECDEDPHDSATTKIDTSGVFVPNGTGQRDFFNIDAWSHGAKFIEKVEVVFVGRISGFTGKITPGLYLPGSDISYGSAETMTTSWVEYTQEISRPSGGNWNWSDLADLQVGVLATGGSSSCKLGNCVQCTQVYALVTYSENYADIELDGHVIPAYDHIYYLCGAASDLGDGDGTYRFDKKLLEETETKTTKYVRCNNNETKTCYGFTEPLIPANDDWETGTLGVKIEVASTSTIKLYLKLSASRVSSSGAVIESSSETAEQQLTKPGADQVYYFEIPSKDWSSGNYGDRLRINYTFRNTDNDPPSTAHATINLGVVNDEVGTDITIYRRAQINLNGHISSGAATYEETIELDGHILLSNTDAVNIYGHILLAALDTIDIDGHVATIALTDTIELDGHIVYLNETSTMNVYGHMLYQSTKDIPLNGHILLSDTAGIELFGHILWSDKTATINLDGHVLLLSSADIDLDGHILLSDTAVMDLDGHVLLKGTEAINLFGHVLLQEIKTLDLYGHVAAILEATIDLSGHVFITGSAVIDMNGHVRMTGSETMQYFGHVLSRLQDTILIEGYIVNRYSTDILVSGEVTDKGIGILSGAGWFNKFGKREKTEFWIKR